MSKLVISLSWAVSVLALIQVQARSPQDWQQNVGTGSSGTVASGNVNTSAAIDASVNLPGTTNGTSFGNSTLIRGSQCGTTFQMYSGKVVQVLSTNFGVGYYHNNEACTWSFEANQCVLSAYCPCVDIPRSWECLGDYLKIRTDNFLQQQRFCGGNKPGQPIYSPTDFLSVRFRSDSRNTATGFTCFVRCEGPGTTIALPTNVTCPQTSISQR